MTFIRSGHSEVVDHTDRLKAAICALLTLHPRDRAVEAHGVDVDETTYVSESFNNKWRQPQTLFFVVVAESAVSTALQPEL